MKTTLITIFIIIFFSNFSWADDHPIDVCMTCEQDDYTALRALYFSTNGPQWTDTTGWPDPANFPAIMPSGTDVSTWYGVTGMTNTCVREINLDGNNLDGTIPVELELMSFLRKLTLPNNVLQGSIPAELGRIPNLGFLHLSNNQLSGNIPSPLPGDYPFLTSLWANSNLLSGNIPGGFGNIGTLQSLLLSDNQLSGPIPPSLGSLMNLQTLWLSSNALTGPIPGELGDLSSLTALTLHNNQLIGCYDPNLMILCSQLTSSTNGHISNGNLLEADWEAFCLQGPNACLPCLEDDYIALRALFLSTNGTMWTNNSGWPDENLFMMTAYATVPPPGFEDLNQWFGVTTNTDGCVTHLILNNNNLDGYIPIEIGNLGNLFVLEAKSNLLIGSIPTSIENLINLTNLDLGANDLSGSLSEELGCLPSIERIYLYSNLFTGCIPPKLSSPGTLTHLGLNNNQLSGGIPMEFGDSNSLLYLNVSNNKLSGCFDDNLSNLCNQLASVFNTDQYISRNNNFFTTWQNFCNLGSSACLSCVDVATFPSPSNGDMIVTGPVTELIAQRNREIIQEAINAAQAASTCISFPSCGMIWIDYPLETQNDTIKLNIDPWAEHYYIPMLHFNEFEQQIYFNQCTLKVNYFDLFMENRNQLATRFLTELDANNQPLATDFVTLDNCAPDAIWQDDTTNLCETCPVCLELNPNYELEAGYNFSDAATINFYEIVQRVTHVLNNRLMSVVVVEDSTGVGPNFLFKDLVIEAFDGLTDSLGNDKRNLGDDAFIFSFDCSLYNSTHCDDYQSFTGFIPQTKAIVDNSALATDLWAGNTLSLAWHQFLAGVIFNSGNWDKPGYHNARQSNYSPRIVTPQTGLAVARDAAHVSGISVKGINEGIAIYHANGLVVADIRSKNFTDSGFSFIYSDNCSLVHSEVAGGGDGNLSISWNSANNNVFNSSIHGLERRGQLMTIESADSNRIENCHIYSGLQGIDFKRHADYNIVENNIFDDNHVSVFLRSTDRQGVATETPSHNIIRGNSITSSQANGYGPTPAGINLMNSSNTVIDSNEFDILFTNSGGFEYCIYGILFSSDNKWENTHPNTTISNNLFMCDENHIVSLPACHEINCKPIDSLRIIDNEKIGGCIQAETEADYRLNVNLANTVISGNNHDCAASSNIDIEMTFLNNQDMTEIDIQGQNNHDIIANACPGWIPVTYISGNIGSNLYDDNNIIESDATIVAGSSTTYKAAVCILLDDNFTVEPSTMFLAEIEKCIEQ